MSDAPVSHQYENDPWSDDPIFADNVGGSWALTVGLANEVVADVNSLIGSDPRPHRDDLILLHERLVSSQKDCQDLAAEFGDRAREGSGETETPLHMFAERITSHALTDLKRAEAELSIAVGRAEKTREKLRQDFEEIGSQFADTLLAAQAARLIDDNDEMDRCLRQSENTLNSMWETLDVDGWRHFSRGLAFRAWSLCKWWPYD